MLAFLIDNIFVMFGGRVFNRQSAYLWVQTVLLSRRVDPLFICGRLHTGASQEEQKEAIPIPQFHVPLYR